MLGQEIHRVLKVVTSRDSKWDQEVAERLVRASLSHWQGTGTCYMWLSSVHSV